MTGSVAGLSRGLHSTRGGGVQAEHHHPVDPMSFSQATYDPLVEAWEGPLSGAGACDHTCLENHTFTGGHSPWPFSQGHGWPADSIKGAVPETGSLEANVTGNHPLATLHRTPPLEDMEPHMAMSMHWGPSRGDWTPPSDRQKWDLHFLLPAR